MYHNIMVKLLALAAALTIVTCVSPTLKQVIIITRHGARSPRKPLPNDNRTKVWEDLGLNQLTTLGMQEMYQLGEFIRNRYPIFIDRQYNRFQLKVRSTDVDRALESAQIMLAALYPPSGDQIWNNNINWQPIPVHTIPKDQDYLLDMDAPCPRYDQIVDETRQTELYKNMNDSYKEMYEIMKYHTGMEGDFNITRAWNIWDTLYCNNYHGLGLPDWATEDLMVRIQEEMVPFEYSVRYGSAEKNRLKGGPMVHEILSNFHNLELDSGKNKMILFSAHDLTVINQLIAYGNYEWYLIPYASALFVELLETEPSQYVVHLALRNSTTEDVAITLTLPGCTDPCPLDMFTHLLTPHRLRPEDLETACAVRDDFIKKGNVQETMSQTDVIVVVAVAGIGLVFIIAFITRGICLHESDMKTIKFETDTERTPYINENSETIIVRNS